MVDVSISASPTLLIEEENTTTTLIIELSEPPPADDLIVPFDVSIESGRPKPLAQFDLTNINFEGAELETVNRDTFNEFALVVQAQTARLTLPVSNNEFEEGVEEVTFQVRDTADFDIAPDAGDVTFTIADNAAIAPEPPEEPEEPIEQGGQLTQSPESDQIFNVVAPEEELVTIRHEVTSRDNSNEVFEIGYTFLNEEQSLPETASEKLEAVNNGASLFSVYPNTFANGEPGQFDFFNLGFRNATNSLERIISAENGDRIAYYLIEGQDITSDTVNASNVEKVQFDFLEVTEENNQFTLAGDNVTFTAETVDPKVRTGLRTGTNLQAEEGLEVFDLRESTGSVTATLGFDVISQAEFDNVIGFYTVQDQAGTINTGNGIISPEENGYTEAALANSRQNFGEDAILRGGAAQGDRFTVEGGQIMVPFILPQGGDLEEIPSELPEGVQAYFPFIGANSDGADHFRTLADNTFGIEDRAGGGDQDFNDIIFQLDFA